VEDRSFFRVADLRGGGVQVNAGGFAALGNVAHPGEPAN
jgi:hypothetical protein